MTGVEVEIEDEAWTAALPDAEALVVRAVEAACSSPVFGGGGEEGRLREQAHRNDNDLSFLPTNALPRQSWAKLVEGASDVRSPSASSLCSSAPPPDEGEETNITVLLTSDGAVQDLNARFRGKDGPTNVLSFPAAESARPHLGDIALAYGVCAAEAEAQGKPLAHHLTHLTVHGVLHLLGYDHESDGDAEAMEALERTILGQLGVPDPYALEANA